MAAAFTCDGCGLAVAKPMRIGRVTKRDYCEECAERADAFIDAEEALRKRVQEQFINDRALLIAKASEGGFLLPDVPNAG